MFHRSAPKCRALLRAVLLPSLLCTVAFVFAVSGLNAHMLQYVELAQRWLSPPDAMADQRTYCEWDVSSTTPTSDTLSKAPGGWCLSESSGRVVAAYVVDIDWQSHGPLVPGGKGGETMATPEAGQAGTPVASPSHNLNPGERAREIGNRVQQPIPARPAVVGEGESAFRAEQAAAAVANIATVGEICNVRRTSGWRASVVGSRITVHGDECVEYLGARIGPVCYVDGTWAINRVEHTISDCVGG